MPSYYIIDRHHYLSSIVADSIERAGELLYDATGYRPDYTIEARPCPHGKLLPPELPEWMEYIPRASCNTCSRCQQH